MKVISISTIALLLASGAIALPAPAANAAPAAVADGKAAASPGLKQRSVGSDGYDGDRTRFEHRHNGERREDGYGSGFGFEIIGQPDEHRDGGYGSDRGGDFDRNRHIGFRKRSVGSDDGYDGDRMRFEHRHNGEGRSFGSDSGFEIVGFSDRERDGYGHRNGGDPEGSFGGDSAGGGVSNRLIMKRSYDSSSSYGSNGGDYDGWEWAWDNSGRRYRRFHRFNRFQNGGDGHRNGGSDGSDSGGPSDFSGKYLQRAK